MSEQARRSYRFGPLERRGLLGPLRAGQATAIVLAGLCALLALTSLPGDIGLVTAFGVFGLTLLVTLVPAAGRTGDEWGPLLARFAARRVTGRLRWHSPLPTAGWRSSVPGAGRRSPPPGADGPDKPGSPTSPPARGRSNPGALTPPAPVLPPELRGVELIEVEYGHGRIGALAEPGRRRLTGVIACRAAAFALLDPEAQERRLDRWGTLLASTADSPIRRLQWLERTVPTRSDQLAHWLNDARDPTIPARGTPIVESYLELISAGARVANAHEILLAIQIENPRGSGRRGPSLEAVLVEQLERVAGALAGAEVTVLGAMMPGPLARSLRSAFDPFGAAEMHDFTGNGDEIASHEQGPLGTAEAWDHYRSDGALHTTFWISDWPRVDVSPMFLDPLLGASRVVRTVAVTMAPVAPARSAREVEAAVTRDHADRELRARLGQTETARQRQMQDWTRRREAELAAGHAELRLSGFVTVSARNTEDLRVACNECQQQATQARLGLHRLYGQQAEAFTFTLPLARGLK